MNSRKSGSEFPFDNLTPKRETGVLSFLQKYPEYDGRGVVMAILDSGIDPAAEGLQVTSTGLPKVIERYDCSGHGDVDMSTIVKPDSNGMIAALDGTLLRIPPHWDNPSGEYRLGCKPLYDLYSEKLRLRMEKKRKEDHWDRAHRETSAQVIANSSAKLNSLNANVTTESPPSANSAPTSPLLNSSINDKLEKEEAEAQIESIDALEKKYKDWGPTLNVLLFTNSKSEWMTALSLDQDLTKVRLLGEYCVDQIWMELTGEDKMSVSVNVWDNGNKLEIVSISGGHGTHVAGIAAGYFPNKPELNGVAPGAQIISLSISDGRLDTMETGTALSRAIAFLQKNSHRIHLLNMSYGERAHWSQGRVSSMMDDTVDNYGIIWVSAAGNAGPALSTISTPPFTSASTPIGVGAYVSPQMMESEYGMSELLPGMPFTWTSRGPTLEGDVGVSVSGPGAAITSVPNYLLRNSQLMNGTSMASPHVAGCIALILSASLVKNIPYSPYSVKRALQNSTSTIDNTDIWTVGTGLVQVEPSLEKLISYSTAPERDVRFDVTVNGNQKGIYIRDIRQAKKEYQISVEPVFFKSSKIDGQKKIDFRMNLVLTSTAPWVIPPNFLDISNITRTFVLKVAVEGLSPGVHHAKIEAFDANDTSRGQVFFILATVIVPTPPTSQDGQFIEFPLTNYDSGLIKRYFLIPPKGVSSASLELKAIGPNGGRVVVHAVTLVPGKFSKHEEFYKVVNLGAGEESLLNFRVLEDKIVEICMGRWWSEPRESVQLASKLTYKTLSIDLNEVHFSATDFHAPLRVSSLFQTVEIQPTAVLKSQVCLLRATSMKLQSLSKDRDSFPDGRIVYELISTYPFSLTKGTSVQINCTYLCDTLYEGEYESQLWMIFDSSKRQVASGDVYPSNYATKLEKGEYALRLQVRHDRRELLEKFMPGYPSFSGESLSPCLPLLLTAKLPSSLPLSLHQSAFELQSGKKGSGWSLQLRKGTGTTIFISTDVTDKNMKTVPCSLPTHYLTGSLTLQKEDKKGVPLRLFFPEPAPKLKGGEKSKDDIADQIRELKKSLISKVDKDESLKIFNELKDSSPHWLGIYTTRAAFLETQLKETIEAEAIAEMQAEIKSLLQTVISKVDKNELLAYFGSKNPPASSDPKQKSKMEKMKSSFVEAHVKLGLLFPEESSNSWQEVTLFLDAGDTKVVELTISDAISRGHYGRALKYLNKTEESFGDRDKLFLQVYQKLNWQAPIWLHSETMRFKSSIKDFRNF